MTSAVLVAILFAFVALLAVVCLAVISMDY